PAFRKRAALIGIEKAEPALGISARARKNAAQQHSRHAQAGAGDVAAQTEIGPGEPGLAGGLLKQSIEDDSLLGILGGYFEDWFSRRPAAGDRVIEKHDPRIVGADDRSLQTGLGEDRHLRLDRDFERRKHGTQITARSFEFKRRLAAADLGIERCNGIVERKNV